MKSSEIRSRFLKYFEKAGHAVVQSSSLVPKGDPTLLFTNAGMVQFKSVFLNEETRGYKKAASCQRCLRAGGKHNDLENVGATERHHTFFEMLGNFSFGDYFKEGAIEYAWDFLANEMRLPKDKLWVTVFENDDEAERLWREKAGVPKEKIVRLGAKDNFWAMGETGPCGPCSEILIDQGADVGCGKPECVVGCDCDRFLEIWNLVFMQYNRGLTNELTPLPRPCIDTGMGLERLSAVMQGRRSNYETDLFTPIIGAIEDIASIKYGASADADVSIKAIADHARAVTFLITDGILPGNVDRAYVLRRILRRAGRHGRFLGIKEPFLYMVNEKVIETMGHVYPEIIRAKETVARATQREEERFFETLERGLGLLEEEVRGLRKRGEDILDGKTLFKLYDTYGFPIDLTADIVKREGIGVDEEGFVICMDEQRKKARGAWKGAIAGDGGALYKTLSGSGLKTEFVGYHMEACSSRILCIIKEGRSVDTASKGDAIEIIAEETPFYGESGGQAGDAGIIFAKDFSINVIDTKRPFADLIVHVCRVEEGIVNVDAAAEFVPDADRRKATARNHTATHLLHASLRKILGEHVRQAGSLVTPEGLRFDFSHFEAVKPGQLRDIEDGANRAVLANMEVVTEVLPYKDAVEKGALAFFGEKYGDRVRLVSVPGVSAELCGGTHVKRTGDIGFIKIIAESSVASGTRRLEALTGFGAIRSIIETEKIVKESAQILRAPEQQVYERIKKLIEEKRDLEKEIERLKSKGKAADADNLHAAVKIIKGVNVIAVKVAVADQKGLRETADALRAKLGRGVVVLCAEIGGKAVILAAVTRDLTERFSAGEIVKRLAPVIGGKGGGKPDMAEAGGRLPERLDEAIETVYRTVEEIAEEGRINS